MTRLQVITNENKTKHEQEDTIQILNHDGSYARRKLFVHTKSIF